MSGSLIHVFRKYPLVPVTGVLALGIVAGRSLSIPFFAAFVCWAITLVFLAVQKSRSVALLPFFFVLGLTFYSGRYEVFSGNDLRVLLDDQELLARVRGTLLDTPSMREIQQGEKVKVRYSARLRVESIELNGEWHSAKGEVATLVKGDLPSDYFEGQTVEIYGILRPPQAAHIPGLFDFREYLKDRRIFYQVTSESSADWQVFSSENGARKGPPVTERFRRWAKEQLARGIPEDESLRLIWAMSLGWMSALSGETSLPFMQTGTMHIFAISGLHVACIAGLLLGIFKMFGVPRHRIAAIVIPLLWFYTVATGWQSSAIRSALMSSVVICGWALKRPSALLNSIAASALIILLWQPEQLMQTSFQLSFAVVLAIALLMPPFEEARQKWFAADPFLVPTELSRWHRLRHKFGNQLSTAFLVSLAAWCGSLPIVAYYFNMVTPVSLCANLLAVPLSSGALVFTLFSLAIPPLGPVFNWCAWVLMWVTIKVTEAFATFPFGWFYVPKPGVWLFLFYFTLLAFLVFQGWRSSSKARWLRYPAVLTGLTWILFSFPGWMTTQLTVLPVSGTPLHADFAGLKRDVLVNCSSEYEMDTLLKRYLRAEGVGTLHNVILARADVAHSGGFFTLLNEFKPKQVYTSAWKSRSSSYKRILPILDQMPNRWTRLAAGAKAELWQLLHPKDVSQFTRAADQGLVLLGKIQGWKVLYLPGPGTKAQEELRHTLKDLHTDIVVASIGERDEMPDPSLIQQLKPRVLIIGNSGYSNKEGAVERAESLRGTCANVLNTQSSGAIRLKFRGGSCEIETMNGLPLLIHR